MSHYIPIEVHKIVISYILPSQLHQYFVTNNLPQNMKFIYNCDQKLTFELLCSLFDYPKMILHHIHISEPHMEHLFRIPTLTQLSHLTISNCSNQYLKLPTTLSNIRSLQINQSFQLVQLTIPSTFTNLRNVYLDCPRVQAHTFNIPITIHSLNLLNTTLPLNIIDFKSLHKLKLSYNIGLESTHIIGSCTSLHILDLSNNPSLKNIDGLKSCTSLTSLNLSHCSALKTITALHSLLHLTTLNLSYCTNLTLIHFPPTIQRLYMAKTRIRDLTFLTDPNQLQLLDISHCRNRSIETLFNNAKNLHTLYLDYCTNLKTLDPLFYCHKLTKLSFHSCTFTNLNALRRCNFIKILNLSECKNLTDISGLEYTKGIEHIDLSGCCNISSLSPLTGCKTLHTLDLSGCTNLTNITPLATCISLQSLNLSECDLIYNIEPLVSCLALRTLILYGCLSIKYFDHLVRPSLNIEY